MNKREQYLLERLQVTEQTLALLLENIQGGELHPTTINHIKAQMLAKLGKIEQNRKVKL